MASIYDKSSLVLIPSGTKTGKVYSQVPVSGDGDFTFTRSSAATRVNADGFIEKETQNLLLQSNSFDTSPWFTSNASLTGGQAGYNGTNDAWIIENNSSTTTAVVQQPFSLGSSVRSFSVYAKQGNVIWLRILMYDGAVTHQCWFNLTDGSTANSSNLISASATSVGGDWYRCEISANTNITFANIYPAAVAGSSLSDLGDFIYIQDAQLEQGLVARDYIETTTTAVEGGITDNVPRLDYTDSSCPALLLEPQRTNLIPNSEYLGSSDWSKTAFGTGVVPILTFGAESPEGLNNAYEVTFNTGAGTSGGDQSNLTEAIGGQAAGDYTLSFWAKVSSGTDKIIARGAGGYLYTTCNLTTEWQRFEITENLATAGSIYIDIGLRRGLANEPLNSSVTCQIYGIQLEAGSYATSYIPTYGSSVTRNADASSVTGVSDLIGQTEGTLFVEYNSNITEDDSFFLVADDGTINNRIVLYSNVPNKLALVINTGGSLQVVFANKTLATGTNKFAVGYANNDVVLYLNGTQLDTDNTATIPATSALRMGTDHNNASIASGKGTNQVLVFKTRLSNEELAALTTI